MRQLPTVAVLTVVAAGLVAGLADWQLGGLVVGLALLLAGGLRLSLPPEAAGWLVVRTRGLDASLLVGLGLAVVALATTIPEP